MMLLFTTNSSSRLSYIVQQLFADWYGCNVNITTDKKYYLSYSGVKLHYGNARILESEIRIPAVELLFETTITSTLPTIHGRSYQTELFPFSAHHKNDWSFDILAASFWLLTRYEEYLPFKKDAHGRFEATASLAYQHQFIDIPLIQVWMEALLQRIQEQHPTFQFQKPPTKATTSIDVDQAYAFLNRGIKQQVLTAGKSLQNFNFKRLVEQVQALSTKKDPYDTFDYLNKLAERHHTSFLYFFLLGKKRSKTDNNLAQHSNSMQLLLQQTKTKHRIGIHPSYLSNQQPTLLTQEVAAFQRITKEKPTLSRQHYLMLTFPTTYAKLLQQGIQMDYTMGYAYHYGFRASTAIPFKWFDLTTNTSTNLMVHPFCYMDGTFKNYMKISPEIATAIINKLWNTVSEHGGVFIHIWHNESVNDYNDWQGWQGVFEHTLNTIHH